MSQEHSSTNDSNSSINGYSSSRNSLHYEYENDQRLNSLKLEKPIYESSPVARNTIENNQVKIINYRGIKLTSFNVDGRQLICLPQAFDFFLKHLVGGLHTVYTKLKRLQIIPIVCNVEQVRILRSLAAIQPGVNRCKLLAPNEFDILYEDCTNSSSRPGRPPKRNIFYKTDDSSLDREKNLRSNIYVGSYSDLKSQIDSNNYLSKLSKNQNQLSLINTLSCRSTFPYSYISNNRRTTTTTTTTSNRSISSNQSRSFTIDSMLCNNRDKLTKPIDLSMTTIEQTSSSPSSSSSSSLSSILPIEQITKEPVNFFHINNMIELTVENARLHEKQLENEIVDLKNEITKEQDCRKKLEEDFVELRRIRNVLIKKLKRLNRSNDSTNNKNLLDK